MISSIEAFSGKSSLIIALGKILQKRGYKIGYFKPFGIGRYVGRELIEEDVSNVVSVLGVEDSLETICPVIIDRPYLEFEVNAEGLKELIYRAYEKVREGKDVVLVEGALSYEIGKFIGLSDDEVARMLNLNVVMIVKFDEFVLDKVAMAKQVFGDRLKQVVLNFVSGYIEKRIEKVSAKLENIGVELVGAIPKDPFLSGTFLSDVVDVLNGKYLVEPKEDVVIEQILVGAMTAQSALEHFRRCRNCAVITGGDRSDIIVTAMEVPNVKCLILTGNLEPPSVVLGVAKSKGIPIVLVPYDTLTTVSLINKVVGKGKMKGKKVDRMVEIVKEHVNVDRLVSLLCE
ncbi:DRTGG domain-containing protein [Archaeoglobus sp.]